MSVHDVALVDRLNSLQQTTKSEDKRHSVKNETSRRATNQNSHNASPQTSNSRDRRSNEDTLRRAMAKHQASLSKPVSTISSLTDEMPPTSDIYSRSNPIDSKLHHKNESVSPNLKRDGYRTVTATKTTSSVRMESTNKTKLPSTKNLGRNSIHSELNSTGSNTNSSPVKRLTPSSYSNESVRYRKSAPVSPANSLRSSRAVSPAESWSGKEVLTRSGTLYSRRSSRAATPMFSRPNSQRSSRATSPENSIKSSRSVRSSRNASPNFMKINQGEIENIASELKNVISLKELKSNPLAQVIYVRETFEVVPSFTDCCAFEQSLEENREDDLPSCHLLKLGSEESCFKINTTNGHISNNINFNDIEDVNKALNQTDENKVSQQGGDIEQNKSIHYYQKDELSSSLKSDKATIDISAGVINNIEEILKSLSQRVNNMERIEKDFERADDLAESLASHRSVSVPSGNRGVEDERLLDAEAHSLIRRQSIIIEGLTTETEELRKKCQVFDVELGTPLVEDLTQKLEHVEGKLEETETHCHHMFEENVGLKSEIEALETQISEVQDTFRDKDANEFQNIKWELENLSKICRNLQIKLEKAQANATRLGKEKELIEYELREQTPFVEDLNEKLEQVEGKLEETENFCYKVVEENVELKSEIGDLESEIFEVQDTFRDNDAKEFQRVKWELENLSKVNRNLQIKLGKAQAKANRLRQEKEILEDEQNEQGEQSQWKTSALAAVAALAAYHLLSKLK